MSDTKILIVEDEGIIAEDLKNRLRKLGYVVPAVASSGEEAVQKAAETRPDLVLMDIRLKGEMTGVEAAGRIRDRFDIPVIYLTAYADENTLHQAKITEPFGYVLKPFDERELHIAIEMARYKHRMEQEIIQSHKQMRRLSAHLESIREEERTRLAREIHDELGQALTALKMDLSYLDRKLATGVVLKEHRKEHRSLSKTRRGRLERRSAVPKTRKEALQEKLQSMTSLISATIQAVRRISTELRPGVLDDLGLTAAIEWQAQEFEARSGIQYHWLLPPDEVSLDRSRSTAVFRIFQEALINVARHAGATRVDISMKSTEREFLLEIRDNGRGITLQKITDPRSFGLLGMRERALLFGGEVRISGVPGQGTTVAVGIPLG